MGNKVHRWQHQHRPGTHPLWRSWNFHLTWLLNKTIIHVHSFMILGDEAVIYDHRWFFSWFTFPPFTFIHLWFLGMRMTLSDMAELAKFKWFAGHSICHTSLGRGSQDRRVGGHPFGRQGDQRFGKVLTFNHPFWGSIEIVGLPDSLPSFQNASWIFASTQWDILDMLAGHCQEDLWENGWTRLTDADSDKIH